MNDTESRSNDEDAIARLLQAAGPREELPQHLKQSWEAGFREALAPVVQRRKRQRRQRVLALCASVALLALVALFRLQPATTVERELRLGQAVGDVLITAPSGQSAAALQDQTLPTGVSLATREKAYLSLVFGEYDLRLNSVSEVRVEADAIHLLGGEIYISNESGRARREPVRGPITVHTPFATVRDIGTQFTVALDAGRVVSTVRRGSIVVNTGDAAHTAEAGTTPRRITVNRQRELSSAEVEPGAWTWIYALSPPFELEGSSAYDFLQWSVSESGRALEFASDSAETYARITTLHGDISGLDPEQALAPVLATTHLRAEPREDNTLLVTLLPR